MISPSNFPVKIVASRIFPVILLMTKRVPLHNLGGFKLQRRIIGEPISTEDCVVAFLVSPENLKIQLESLRLGFHQQLCRLI